MTAKTNEKNSDSNNNGTFAIALSAVVAIVIITILAISSGNTNTTANEDDMQGAVAGVMTSGLNDGLVITSSACKIVVGKNPELEGTELITSLGLGEYVNYDVYRIAVADINSNGCNIAIDGNGEFIAEGQIQKIGPVYVTVREVLE